LQHVGRHGPRLGAHVVEPRVGPIDDCLFGHELRVRRQATGPLVS
jgi:hypothetical protein